MKFAEAKKIQDVISKEGFQPFPNEEGIRYLDLSAGESVASISLDMFDAMQKYTDLRNGGMLSDGQSYSFVMKIANRPGGPGKLATKLFLAESLAGDPIGTLNVAFENLTLEFSSLPE